jgi:hypothetical protein
MDAQPPRYLGGTQQFTRIVKHKPTSHNKSTVFEVLNAKFENRVRARGLVEAASDPHPPRGITIMKTCFRPRGRSFGRRKRESAVNWGILALVRQNPQFRAEARFILSEGTAAWRIDPAS